MQLVVVVTNPDGKASSPVSFEAVEDVSPHAYFNWASSLPSAVSAFPLRSEAEITRYSQRPQDMRYLWPSDPDSRRQDAAKLVIPSDGTTTMTEANRNSIHQVRIPMPRMELGHAYLVVWDGWYGAEWDFNRSGIGAHKAFQFDGPNRPGGSNQSIWWEVSHRYQRTDSKGNVWLPPDDLARLSVRHYASPMIFKNGLWIGVPVGPNVTSGSASVTPITPYKQFNIRAETWTRYFQLIEYGMDPEPWRTNPPGTLMSMWAADENREPFQIYNRLQVTLWEPGCARFWIEFNTSQNEVKANRGNLIAYFRNVVMLKDAPVAALLQKPVRAQ